MGCLVNPEQRPRFAWPRSGRGICWHPILTGLVNWNLLVTSGSKPRSKLHIPFHPTLQNKPKLNLELHLFPKPKNYPKIVEKLTIPDLANLPKSPQIFKPKPLPKILENLGKTILFLHLKTLPKPSKIQLQTLGPTLETLGHTLTKFHLFSKPLTPSFLQIILFSLLNYSFLSPLSPPSYSPSFHSLLFLFLAWQWAHLVHLSFLYFICIFILFLAYPLIF